MSSRSLINVSFFLSSLVLSLVLAEGLLRLFPSVLSAGLQKELQTVPEDLGVSHPYIGHLHKPNNTGVIWSGDFRAVHHTDNHGFRNAWPWPERAEIVAVGDSLTFGYGVEDDQAWPAILDEALPQMPVVNLGLIGAGTQQYLRVYETFGIPLHPQVLLVGFFAGNDFTDAGLFERWLESGVGGNYMVWRDFGRHTRSSLRSPIGSIRGLLRTNSYVYNLLRYGRNVYRRWLSSEPKVLRFEDGTQLHLTPTLLMSHTTGAQPDHPEFGLVLRDLQTLHSIAKENGTHVLIVFQPAKEEIYMPFVGEVAPDPGGPLRAALEDLDIPYLDLAESFRQQAAAGERLFFTADGHPNARGYALIAETVLSHLKHNARQYGLAIAEKD